MHSSIFVLLVTTFSLLSLPSSSLPPYRNSLFPTSLHAPPQQPPTQFFEVTHPIKHPPTTPCSHVVLHHSFGFTYGQPPVTAPYAPPTHCRVSRASTIVLEWCASCQGRQFDRIFGVWLNGVELLRSCTAEPTKNGIFWSVKKDITRYFSLLTTNGTLSVYLGNLVDKTYTGIYHVNVTIHYYPRQKLSKNRAFSPKIEHGYGDFADLVLPISRNLPLNDGLWFEIENSTDIQSKEVVIPKNVYRAVLEVYVSYHENDEFWFSNLPNEYIIANNLTGSVAGNGPFREVLVSLDGDLVGAVWPFTVIFTGGINPLLWRPISAIGSFDLPSYDIEITPFLGKLLDGKGHEFGFGVEIALNVWYVDANLHLWLDKKRGQIYGQLLQSVVVPLMFRSRSDFRGLDGEFFTDGTRSISSIGWVESSHGNITTTSIQCFRYTNNMVVGNSGNLQTVNQTFYYHSSVSAAFPSSSSAFFKSGSHKRFPLFLYTNQVDQGNKSYSLVSNVTLGFNEDKVLGAETDLRLSSLWNEQRGDGDMLVKNNLVVSGWGSTQQIYKYDESNGLFCYSRNVSSFNFTILYDKVKSKCESTSRNYVFRLANRGILLQA